MKIIGIVNIFNMSKIFYFSIFVDMVLTKNVLSKVSSLEDNLPEYRVNKGRCFFITLTAYLIHSPVYAGLSRRQGSVKIFNRNMLISV